jgi:hypothetical protein
MRSPRPVHWWWLATVAGAALVAGCGGGGTGGGAASGNVVHFEGRISIGAPLAHGCFDARSARAQKAVAQVTELLGHPLEFHYDASLVPKWEFDFEELCLVTIERVATDLVELKRRFPAIFAWASPRLARIEWDYSATAEWTEWKFDGKTIRIVLTSREWRVMPEKAIQYSLADAYADDLEARFAHADPSRLGDAELSTYADFILAFGYSREKKRHPPQGDDEALDATSARLSLTLVILYDAAKRRPELEKKVRHALLEDVRRFAYARNAHSEEAERAAPSSDFRRGEAAFVAWLNANFETLSYAERENVIHELSNGLSDDGPPKLYPGFDYVGVWSRTMDAWVAAGKPLDAKTPSDEARAGYVGNVIAPAAQGESCGRSRNPFYRDVPFDAPLKNRMFGDAIGKKDVVVLRTILHNFLELESPDIALALWRATEKDDALFRGATRSMAGFADRCSHTDPIYDELARLWKAHTRPAERGALFFAIRQFGNHRDSFPRVFGLLTKDEFAAYLDEEPDPLRELHYAWPVLGKGWSHGEPVLARLDKWLTDDYKKKESWWGQGLGTLASDLCGDKALEELKRLHAYVDRRLQAHPSEENQLREAFDRTQPGACKP